MGLWFVLKENYSIFCYFVWSGASNRRFQNAGSSFAASRLECSQHSQTIPHCPFHHRFHWITAAQNLCFSSENIIIAGKHSSPLECSEGWRYFLRMSFPKDKQNPLNIRMFENLSGFFFATALCQMRIIYLKRCWNDFDFKTLWARDDSSDLRLRWHTTVSASLKTGSYIFFFWFFRWKLLKSEGRFSDVDF